MCLNPVFIANPEYVRRTNEFPIASCNGREIYYRKSPFDVFNYKYFNRHNLGVTSDNVDNYVAYNPITGESIPLFVSVPCGKCLECRDSKRKQLYQRMVCEQIGHDVKGIIPLFFTLTYNDENLPKDGVSCLDVRLFFNRFYTYLRRAGYKGDSPRHIVFSEYSPTKHRAHYHGIIFGLDVAQLWPHYMDFVDFFEKTWNKGFVHIKHFLPHGFNYVSKYVLKEKNAPDDLNPNFWFGSRQNGGIGSFALQNPDFVSEFYRNLSTLRFEFKVCGEIITVNVPKSVRTKILQTASSCIPKAVKDAVYNVASSLAVMHRLCEIRPSNISFLDKYDYVFPPELVDKLPYFRYIFDYSTDSSCIPDDYVLTFSPDQLIAIYEDNVSVINSFLNSSAYDRHMYMFFNYDRLMSAYHSYVERHIKELPEPSLREHLLKIDLETLNSRNHFAG